MAKLSETEKAINQRLKEFYDVLYEEQVVTSITDFCEQSGLDRSNFSKYWRDDKDQKEVKAEVIVKLTQSFGLNPLWLLNNEGKMFLPNPEVLPTMQVIREAEARPLIITVDTNQREVIPLVPVKARAGYLTGYKDPVFVSTLPSYSIPGFTNGTFRMFEVQGYSMYQEVNRSGLRPGDVVVCQYVERPQDIKDGRVYVVVNHDDVLIKRCINRLGSAEKLILKSDNLSGEYPDIVLGKDEIVEVWEFKANITRHVPPPSDTYKMLNNITAQLAILMDDFNKRKRLE